MKLIRPLFWICSILFLISCQSKVEIKRPHDPWVFRSVMDEQPRMVTVALNENLWVCYDAQHGGLYNAWKGGVNFDGAVYTTKHGPQPNTIGFHFYENRMEQTPWRVEVNGEITVPNIHFKGYEIREERVYIKYELETADGNTISIEDSPEYVEKGDWPGLSRTFTTKNVPSGSKVLLDMSLSSLAEKTSYSFDGEITVNESGSIYNQGVTLYTADISLVLDNNGTTELITYFHPGSGIIKDENTALEEARLTKGEQLIADNDCSACHNAKVKTVGPSYVEIAEKYPFTEPIIVNLARKVIKGGSGVWGNTAMTAHPDLNQQDARDIVNYILSMDGESKEESDKVAIKLFLDDPSVPFELVKQEQVSGATDDKYYPGLACNVYKNDDYGFAPEFSEENQPQYTGVLPVVHATSQKDLGPLQELTVFDMEGYIDIPETSNYTFRLVNWDQSWLFIDDKEIIDFSGWHGLGAFDGETHLTKGKHKIRIVYYQGSTGGGISFQWAAHGNNSFGVVPADLLSHKKEAFKKTVEYVTPKNESHAGIPGFGGLLNALHPSFDLFQARPDNFEPRVGGIDFLPDGRMVMCTWDSLGPVYIIDGIETGDPSKITVKRIAQGLAEPLGIKVVDGEIYVLQKQELTKLIDHDGDELIDEYQTVCDDWLVSSNFHEFSFGLEYLDGYFYASLATDILPGGAGGKNQPKDRGKMMKIAKADGALEFVAQGLRTPNGVGEALNGQIFVCDNQGDWLPASKLIHVQQGAFYGSYAVNPNLTLPVSPPVVWMPQDEVGNSPSEPTYLNIGPYKDQIIYGEVTNGGIKRVFVEQVNDTLQGALFRFTQGLEAGVNRISWGPDGALYIGGIGVSGNWGQDGKLKYGLQRMVFNGKTTFEMLAVRAKTNGFEIEFTEPIASTESIDASNFKVKQWRYVATPAYGGPKVDLEDLVVTSLTISDDRTRIFLELPGIKAGHVVYFLIDKAFLSETGQDLWNGECWYTLNNIPKNEVVQTRPVQPQAANTLSSAEKAQGWQLLFDGKTTNGWHSFKQDKAGSAWKVSNGALYLDTSRKNDGHVIGGGDLVTNDTYENFELELEWKISQGGNSGIIYKMAEEDQYDYIWQTGPEMQILDNDGHPDGKIISHRAGDLYDFLACNYEVVKPVGQWNHVRIVSNDGHIYHYLNGHKVVSFQMYTPEWEIMVSDSKFKDMPGFGTIKKGNIALQDHGDKVWFRNIKIKNL